MSPPVGGGSGNLPRENFEKMMQNGAIWSVNKAIIYTIHNIFYYERPVFLFSADIRKNDKFFSYIRRVPVTTYIYIKQVLGLLKISVFLGYFGLS